MTEQEVSREQIREVQCELLRQAIDHLPGSCDARTAMIINKHKLTQVPLESQIPTQIADTIKKNAFDRSDAIPLGPYVLVYEGDVVVDAVESLILLLNPDPDLRHSGLAYLDRQVNAHRRVGDVFLSPQTREGIEAMRSAVLSNDGRESVEACLKIGDLLEHDFFYQISALWQATSTRLLGVFENKFRRVLKPSRAMLQFLEKLPVHSPRFRTKEVKNHRRQVVLRASSLNELLREYFRSFGHLPLAGENSLAGVFALWLEKNEAPVNTWEVVWNWASETASPFANYHACELFCGYPELISEKEQRLLLGHIADIILGANSKSRWNLRCRLARHYCQHLETLRSVIDGEQTSAASWWLAEHVAPFYESLDRCASEIANEVSTNAVDGSCSTWTLARPTATGSSLRYGTLYSESVWSVSILAALSESRILSMLTSDCDSFETIEHAIKLPAYTSVHFPDGVGYAFEGSVSILVEHIAKQISGERQSELLRFHSTLARTRDFDEFVSALKDLPHADQFTSRIVLHELRSQATTGIAPTNAFYELLSDTNWRHSMLAGGNEDNIELICSAALELPIKDNNHDWRIYLSHVIAVACKDAQDDGVRRQLFDFLAIASLANNCVSGMQRLLRTDERQQYQYFVSEWRLKLDNLTPISSEWIRAKARALRSVLYVD